MSFQHGRAEHKGQFYKELEKEFDKTLRALVTGIIHDFANPLSGILGRSEFLEKRVVDIVERIEDKYDSIDSDTLEGYKKIIYDVELLVKAGDLLQEMFTNVTDKLNALNDTKWQEINLSELIAAETAFLQFYPAFKRNIKQKLVLDKQIPVVTGIKTEYSLAFSALIRHALNAVQHCKIKELIISTGHDDSHVWVKIKDSGTSFTQIPITGISENFNFENYPDEAKGLFNAVSLLEKYGALFQISNASGFNVVSIRIPWSEVEVAKLKE